MRVLVVEDDAKLRDLLRRGLTEEGHAVEATSTGADALWHAVEFAYDAIVLDVGLPDVDGMDVCRRLRASGCWAPVVMLTAHDGVDERVRGLDVGADDYVIKPVAFAELLARLRAVTRRESVPRPTVLRVGDLHLDPAAHEVRRQGVPVALTAKEFALLHLLMRNAGRVLTRAEIVEHVWDSAYDGDLHVVNVYVNYLRDKIDRPFHRHSIESVRGVGYLLKESPDAHPDPA